MAEDFLELIKTRRSIRSFKNEEVSDALLDKVLEAGTYAPSAMCRQPSVIVAVKDEETRKVLSRMNAAVMGTDKDPYYGAPVILVVLSEGKNFLQDGSCVLENMMLAAHALGLGSVWINRETEMFDTEEGKVLLRKWGLDENLRGVGALALGFPEGAVPAAKPRKEGYIVKI